MVRSDGEVIGTNYKKLFFKHVHEQFFLKKQVHKIDYEREQRDRQILEEKAVFVKRYKKFLLPRNDSVGRNKSRRSSCGDVQLLERETKHRLSNNDRTKSLQIPRRRRQSVVEIKRNNYLEPPVDFPYSFPEWHNRVDEGSFEDTGATDPREIHKEQLLKSLSDFTERSSDELATRSDTETNLALLNKDRKVLNEKPKKSHESNSLSEDLRTVVKEKRHLTSYPLKLPTIGGPVQNTRCNRTLTMLPGHESKRVHFSTEDDIASVKDIDRQMLQSHYRRKSFSEFRSLALKN